MKPIKPITIRKDGETIEANMFQLSIVSDNLQDSMTTYWEILSVTEDKDIVNTKSIQAGNVTISGEDYDNLDTANGIDINEEIYRYVASKLSITLE